MITGRIVGPSSLGTLPAATVGTVVQNVTALRALTGSITDPSVVLIQYSASVPLTGGGVFIWDTSSVGDDGGTRFNAGGLGTSGAGWQRVYSGPLDPRWFGAALDGVTDDSTALGQCRDAAVTLVTTMFVTGNGTPESAVVGTVGSIYQRINGGALTALYVKGTGTGNTGWLLVTTTAANGAANTALRMNAAGTALEWAKLVTGNLAAAAGILGTQLSATAAVLPTQLSTGGATQVVGNVAGVNGWTDTPEVVAVRFGESAGDNGLLRADVNAELTYTCSISGVTTQLTP